MSLWGERCYIIAEAGVNHNGSLELALQLVDAAAAAGADAVKFQTFIAEELATADAPKAAYQKAATGSEESQFAMLERLELKPQMHAPLMQRCRERGIEFLSTAFEERSLNFLLSLGVPALKIPSGEITNAPLLLQAARSGKPLILSTGLSTLGEVEAALRVLAFGERHPAGNPVRGELEAPGLDELCAQLRQRVALLHCVTQYPVPPAEANLRAVDTLRSAFGLCAGYSDHTQGLVIALAAAARGARIIEKHFTLDRMLPGPDHRMSLEPGELKALVAGIRDIEAALLGDGAKAPLACELPNRDIVRKSLVARTALKAGQIIAAGDIAMRRPGTGRSPFEYWELIGTVCPRDIAPGEQL